MVAWLILHPLKQVCVLWNRKSWMTFEPWEDGCRHGFYFTLPHLWQTGSYSAAWMKSDWGNLKHIWHRCCCLLKSSMVKERLLPEIDVWDLISLLFRWSSGNQISSLAAIRCDQWQKLCTHCTPTNSITSWCSARLDALVVFLSKSKAEVEKRCHLILGKQSFKFAQDCFDTRH